MKGQRGQVPTERVGPIIAMLMEERWPERQRMPDEPWGVVILAEKAGCHPDAIDGIVRQQNEFAEFNLVDQILCSLGRPDYWWGVLSDIYWDFNLKGSPKDYVPNRMRRCAAPGCAETFIPAQRMPKQKYCSGPCRHRAHRHRIGLKEARPRGRNRILERYTCARGHEWTPGTTMLDKKGHRRCRVCHNASVARWREKRKAAACA